ncbi:MAG: Ig domain-containing protein [Lachnospiraceae bacterium]|nr:Ig domain-containing protein [Lachnospiraceae bacterium]
MKKRFITRLFCGALASVITFAALKPVPVLADDWDDWDDWDVLWEDDDDDDYMDVIIIDSIIEEAKSEARKEAKKEEERRRQEEERRKKEEEQRRQEEERNRYKSVTGIQVSTNIVTLSVGGSTQVGVLVLPENANNRGVTLTSSNSAVATVDMYANIKAVGPGSAVITARTNENGYTATINVTVTGGVSVPVQANASASRNLAYCQAAAAQILSAPALGVVNLASMTPMSFDINVANAIKARPDVTVATAFPYQGHTYLMTLAPGYNLGLRLDKSGYADWTALFALRNSDPGIVVTAVN